MPATIDRNLIDSGPLIALARAEVLDVIGRLPFQFLCPIDVAAEIEAGEALGHPRVVAPWLLQIPLSHPVDAVARAALGAGEAAVLQVAQEQGVSWVCLEDAKARRAAVAIGLHVTGTLGLLARAKIAGLLPQVRPCVERMLKVGVWFDAELVRRVLAGIGE